MKRATDPVVHPCECGQCVALSNARVVLYALQTGLQLIHPETEHAVQQKWRMQIQTALRIQDAFVIKLEKAWTNH